MEEVLVPLGLFLTIGVIAVSIIVFRHRGRVELQTTLRQAISSEKALSPEAIDQLMEAVNPKRSDMRLGVIWLAIGIAFLIFSSVIPDDEAPLIMAGVSAFPLLIGAGYLLLWRLNRD